MPGHGIDIKCFKNQTLYLTYCCIVCHKLLRDAVQAAQCGHWFCESCISILLQVENQKCPKCLELLTSDSDADDNTMEGIPSYFPDKFVQKAIRGLNIGCIYADKGCTWEGAFGKLESHLPSCEHSVCATCDAILLTVPQEHICAIAGSALQCPLGKLGCTAAIFENRQKLRDHMKCSEITHGALLVAKISKLDNCTIDRKGADTTTYGVQVNRLICEVEMIQDKLRSKEEEVVSLRSAVTKLERNQRLKNADFEERDFRLSLIENSNYDGNMVWKIPQLRQRTNDAENGKYTSIFSLPFYTSRYGYKMCLRLYILGDGIGKGSYMSLYFALMKGEFDNILQWPFPHKITLKLLNQGTGRDVVDTFQPDPLSTSFNKPNSDTNVASGCPRFASHDTVKSGEYIVEDTIFIACSVNVPPGKYR